MDSDATTAHRRERDVVISLVAFTCGVKRENPFGAREQLEEDNLASAIRSKETDESEIVALARSSGKRRRSVSPERGYIKRTRLLQEKLSEDEESVASEADNNPDIPTIPVSPSHNTTTSTHPTTLPSPPQPQPLPPPTPTQRKATIPTAATASPREP